MLRFTSVAAHIVRALSLLLLLVTCALALHAQTINLRADTDAAPAHTVVHLLATCPTATGTVVFYDGSTRIASVTASVGTAELGVATLTAGTHTLTAAAGGATSQPVVVTVEPLPSTGATLTADQPYAFTQTNTHLLLSGLPARATGSVTFSEGSSTFDTVPLSLGSSLYYQAFGDSITLGLHVQQPARYSNLFASAFKFNEYINYANSSAIACDLLPTQILPNGLSPRQDFQPLSSVMIGSTDMDRFGTGAYESLYQACHSAALAWLGIPREYKVLPGDAAVSILSGSWTSQPLPPATTLDSTYGTLYNSTGSGAASFTLTSNGPLYLWYLMGDHLSGSFAVLLDGVPTGPVYQTGPATPIGSSNNPDSTGFALLRFSAAPGQHVLTVNVLSGTVGILAAATPPSPEAASAHPTVLVTDIPNQRSTDAAASPAAIAQYSADAFADAQQLQADGLDIRTVPTHSFLLGQPEEFVDFAHPNELGQQHLADAVSSAFGQSSTAPYNFTHPYGAADDIPVQTLGQHTYTATYLGDSIYAPISASVTVTGVAPHQSITALSAPATTFYVGSPVQLTATVFPPNPGAPVTLLEGTQALATSNLAGSAASFAPAGLAPGIHILHAFYGGDNSNASSSSPDLPIRILQLPSSLALSASATEIAPADALLLTATILPAAATGKVSFADQYTAAGQAGSNTRALGEASLAKGSVQIPLAALTPGSHLFTAVYAGDANDQPSAPSSTRVLVDPYATATTLAATPATTYGNPITFSAHVSAPGATGSIVFLDRTSGASATIPLSAAAATWTTSTLTAGSHNLIAQYSGDSLYAPSTSAPLADVIAPRPSSTVLSIPTGPFYANRPILLSAAVSPVDANGTVAFLDTGGGTLGQGTIAQGTATLLVSALSVGNHALVAQYSGDSTTATSSSSAATLFVHSTETTTALSAPATAAYAAAVTLLATVVPAPATGLVTFRDGSNLLGSSALGNGTASLLLPPLPSGLHSLSATFTGDTAHDPSTGSTSLTITPGSASVALLFAQPSVLAGSAIVVNSSVATGTSALATGIVTLQNGSTTVGSSTLGSGAAGTAYATFSLPTTAAGTYSFTATYLGDGNTAPASSAPATYTVNPRVATGTLLLSSAQVPPQTPITLTATFTAPGGLVPTGSVVFLNGTNTVATTPLDSAGRATATLPAAAIGTYRLSAVYNPTGVFSSSAVPAQLFTVTPPLALAFSLTSVEMTAASTRVVPAAVTTLSGFQGALSATCAVPESFLTCTVDAPANLTTSTQANVHISVLSRLPAPARSGSSLLAFLAMLLISPLLARRRRLPTVLLSIAALALLAGAGGCATGGDFDKIPAGSHVIQLNATAAGVTATANLTVTIK